MVEKLKLNALTFDYPKKPVMNYFSEDDAADKRSTILKSPMLIPTEVKSKPHFCELFAGAGGFQLHTSFDKPMDGFEATEIDFNNPENEYFVKRYYNHRLSKYFDYYDDVVVTKCDITKDLVIWVPNKGVKFEITYQGKNYGVMEMDRFTLRVKYDPINQTPYLLVANDRPALLLNAPLSALFANESDDPFGTENHITPSMINLVMTRKECQRADGSTYVIRRIDKYEFLKSNNKYCPPDTTRPIMGGDLKRFFGLDQQAVKRSFESKYIKYRNKIEAFRQRFLNNSDIEKIFPNLAYAFTTVSAQQIGRTDSCKRMLVFGRTVSGFYKNERQQYGVNFGPRICCPYTDVRLIAIYPKRCRYEASHLLNFFKHGYEQSGIEAYRKRLGKYMGTNVDYADPSLHIEFENEHNPVEEIKNALYSDAYRNLDPKVKYVGIYVSPIHKYGSDKEETECYYKIKELFLKRGIVTQAIEFDKMKNQLDSDNQSGKKNFIYSLQNMGIAICAKLGGVPWLLDEVSKKELIIGIGAFKSDMGQYIGAAFSFSNTGVFDHYNYFEKSEIDELVGAIQYAIIQYIRMNDKPKRLIIHYYKKLSQKYEARKIETMLHNLNLDIPVYIVTINKTESEDVVVFDEDNSDLMPYSGTWVNLGKTKNGYRYLLCNNTRYEDGNFKPMDGFPFPVKMTITSANSGEEIPSEVIRELIDQVYQFSRIYWKSVKQQALPVTIKYPEMIAEIMPHFNDPTVHIDDHCLWFI